MSIRIGLVEDNSTLRTSFKENIAYFDQIELTLVAENGRHFLEQMAELAPEARPQVVLMDIEMDEVNGIEAVAQGHQLYPEVLFVMLTVFDNDDKIFESIQAGAMGYLLKDEKTDKIVEAIVEVTEGGSPMSPSVARRTLQILRGEKTADTTVPGERPYDEILDELLSRRELEILEKVVAGFTYQEISKQMYISPHTVRTHIQHVYQKLQLHSKAAVIHMAVERQWFVFGEKQGNTFKKGQAAQ